METNVEVIYGHILILGYWELSKEQKKTWVGKEEGAYLQCYISKVLKKSNEFWTFIGLGRLGLRFSFHVYIGKTIRR